MPPAYMGKLRNSALRIWPIITIHHVSPCPLLDVRVETTVRTTASLVAETLGIQYDYDTQI